MAGISGFECLEGVFTIPKKSHLCAWCHNYDISYYDNMVCTMKNMGYNVKSILMHVFIIICSYSQILSK